jgi:hypothetical protein
MKVLSDYDPEEKKKQSPFYVPPTLLSRTSGPGDFNQSREINPARRMAEQMAEQKRMNFFSSVRLKAEEEFGKIEAALEKNLVGDGTDAGVQPLLDQFNKTAEALRDKAPDDRAKAFVDDILYELKMRYAEMADKALQQKVMEQAGSSLPQNLKRHAAQAAAAPAEALEQILQNSLTEVEAQAMNGLALNQEQAEALKAKLPSEFWGGVMRDRIENDPDETLALLNDQNRLFGMDPETRMGLTILAQAEQSRRTGEDDRKKKRDTGLFQEQRWEKLLAMAETGRDDLDAEARISALGQEDISSSWKMARAQALGAHSFLRRTEGLSFRDRFTQALEEAGIEGEETSSRDMTLNLLRKQSDAFGRDPAGFVAAKVDQALGPNADPAERLRLMVKLQREMSGDETGFTPRVLRDQDAAQWREEYSQANPDAKMELLKKLDTMGPAFKRHALGEIRPGLAPQLALHALENNRSTNQDLKLWLRCQDLSSHDLTGDSKLNNDIGLAALQNLETSPAFQAMLAAWRLAPDTPGEERSVRELVHALTRFAQIKGDPWAPSNFLDENFRGLHQEGLASVWWLASKPMGRDLPERLERIRDALRDMLPDFDGNGVWTNAPNHEGFILVGEDEEPVRDSEGRIVRITLDRIRELSLLHASS